jgi:hypothetical protein
MSTRGSLSGRLAAFVVSMAMALCASCVTAPKDFDFRPYLQHMPRSILVLPPLNDSPEVDATYGCLSMVTLPLAERGYYVFPVAVVDAMMKENGLPTPVEMQQVSLQKIDEIFGADAVLYLKVKSWGTSYRVLNSATTVTVEGRLVDVKSGVELWHGSRTAQENSGSGGQGLSGMLLGAIVHQVTTSASDPSRGLAGGAHAMLYDDPHSGLLEGARHPDYEASQKKWRTASGM